MAGRLASVVRIAEKTRAAAEGMRAELISMQTSKFWKVRNAWFDAKHRIGLSAAGARPPADVVLERIETAAGGGTGYDRWISRNGLRPGDVQVIADTVAVLPRSPVISVLVPVFDPPERYLREALDSVLAQLYPHWELCVADDASTLPHVRRVLAEYAARDPRVKLALRDENGHIAAASNSALALATGEYVALLDHDDVLARDALFHVALAVNRDPDADFLYSDEDKIDEDGHRSEPYFKPDWAPDSLLARMYTGHLAAFRRALVTELGGFRTGFEGSQDYDLVLRLTERTERIRHIPRVLYHWRIHPASTASSAASKGYAYEAGRRALEAALARRGEPGRVEQLAQPGTYAVRYALQRPEKISIVMPTRDHGDDVERALASVFAAPAYPDFEVVLVDNGSTDPASLATFARWSAAEPRVRVLRYDVPFNFAAINNYAARNSGGTYLLFLNNDVEVVTKDWLEAMVEQAQRPSIGAVGPKLLYPDGTIQHAGVVTGIGGIAGHVHKYADGGTGGYFNILRTVNNYSALTGACLMLRREVFERAGGFDEALGVAFNDVDLCLKIGALGLRNVYLPHVVLVHDESKSRGYEDTADKQARYSREAGIMQERWHCASRNDPYYNPHLTLEAEDFSLRL
ncbi:MAG TPA: glycosyltransferase family 2 protein [Candidatus Elarobacter sp.]